MYKRILAAVNEHINSEVSAKYALRLAKTCNAKFYICFIAEKGAPEESVRKAQDAIQRLFIEAERLEVRTESIAETGEVFREIASVVRHEGIEIAFVATRREDVERRFYSGTLARSLSVGLPCSVALVRVVHLGKIHPKKILVPLKAHIKKLNERAWFTVKLAKSFESKVIVFHATKPITKFFQGEIHLTPWEWGKKLPNDIAGFNNFIRKSGIELEGMFAPVKTAKGITIEAASKRHDLILMGASERGMLSSIVKGDPVETVLRETPCDLIILNPRHEDK